MTEAPTYEDRFREICARDGPLRERLQDFSKVVRELSPTFAEAYDDLVARLEFGEAGAGAPAPGDAMPPFLLPGGGGRLVSLAEILQSGPAVISFNRGHWCEYCAIELTALRQALGAFAAEKARVVSIMPETREFVRRASEYCGDGIEVLSDIDNAYALEMGLVIWLGERIRDVFLADGVHIERFQGSQTWFVPIPATYVVGPDGIIGARSVDPDFRRRMEISDILSALRRLRDAGQ
jgi:peroxiredoxin